MDLHAFRTEIEKGTFLFPPMPALTFASLSLAIEEFVIPWLVAHHIFDVTVNQWVSAYEVKCRVIHAALFLCAALLMVVLYKESQKLKLEKAYHIRVSSLPLGRTRRC